MTKTATFALFAICVLSAALLGCDLLKPMGEGEYTFRTDGPPAYFCESFEKNDGTTSTEHHFVRKASASGQIPTVSKDWAYEGIWSMKIPAGASLSFDFDPIESGYLDFVIYGDPSSAKARSLSDGRTRDLLDMDPDPTVFRSSQFFQTGSYIVSFSAPAYAIYVDGLSFAPFLQGTGPADGGIADRSPMIQWSYDEAGTPFRIQVSEFEDFSTLLADASGLNSPNYQLTDLDEGKCYFWKVLSAPAAATASWSSPRRFYVPALPKDDSFESMLIGPQALNAWYGKGAFFPPTIVSSNASEGTHSLRLDQSLDAGRESWLEMAVKTDTPLVLRYAYRIVGQSNTESPDLYMQFSCKSEAGNLSTTKFGIKAYVSDGAWTRAAELIPQGSDILRWSFVRNADNSFPGAYVLIDDLRFEEPARFEAEDFEPIGGSGASSFAWGFGGWKPPMFLSAGGAEGDSCVSIPKVSSDYELSRNLSRLRLISDHGEGPFILAFESKGSQGEAYLHQNQVDRQLPALSTVYKYDLQGWREQFFWIGSSTGPNVLDIVNPTSAPLLIDGVRRIDFSALDESGFADDFETGLLDSLWYYDRTSPPVLDSLSPHSGSYCLRLDRREGPYRSFVALPIEIHRNYKVSFWVRCDEGTENLGHVSMYHDPGPESITISSAWAKKTYTIHPGSWPIFPLTFLYSWWNQGNGGSVYIDDIEILPE